MTPAFPADLDGQFLLSPDPLPPDPFAGGPHAGVEVPLPSLHLRVWPRARAVRIADAAGRPIGAALGTAVDLDTRRVLRDELRFDEPAPEDPAELDGFVERRFARLAGAFALVIDAPAGRRLYLDACGARSAVYDPAARLAGATAPAILGREATVARFDRDLHAALDITGDGWLPAGLTAHRGVRRLMANHVLDLDRFETHRCWPLAPIPQAEDPRAACGRILGLARSVVDALRADGPTAMSLTAGNETRLLLAACRDVAGEIDFVCAEGPAAALDLHRARQLADRFGLRLRALPHRRADAAAAADWHARAGQCIGGGNMWNHPTVAPLAAEGRLLIAGFGGEIGRGFFWRPTDTADTPVTVETVTARFGMPPHPRVREAVRDWLEELDPAARGFDAFQTLDLAYLELRMSCWAFAQAYVAPDLPEVSPLISRASFAEMLSLPPEWRRGNRMITEGVSIGWPELLELPINRYGDWRDYTRLLGRAARNPGLVVRKLRRRFG